jgi:uncharacterized protein YidB (DUF937 family)
MGLFDSIAGQVLGQMGQGGGAGGSNGMVDAIGGLLNNPQIGGLQGLVQLFQEKGLGPLIASWIGTGQNLPISAEQLQSVLGSEQVRAIAAQLGFSPDQAASSLASLLPDVIDKLTPGGSIGSADALGGLLGMLKGGGR